MKYLVWKQGSPYNNWVISFAESHDDLYQGCAENLPNWFTTRKDALNFIRQNFRHRYKISTNGFLGYKWKNKPADTYIYRRGNRSYGSPTMVRFNWSQNYTYLGV
jgi:hypothetical protein